MTFVFEDQWCFVAYKPSGLHSISRDKNDSLAELLALERPELKSISGTGHDSGLVQRLDFETSGILLGAKSPEAWDTLRSLVQAGGVKKSYMVLLEGLMTEAKKVEGFIGSPYRRAKKVRFIREPADRFLPAAAKFTPIAFDSKALLTVARAEAPVARRHQIRAMAAALGFPLLGDALYGAKRDILPGSPRFWLHAATLSYVHPWSGLVSVFQSPWPDYWKELFTRLEIDPVAALAPAPR